MTIYQVFTRLFGAQNPVLTPGGTKAQNGCGTMADFTPKALREIKELGITHVWYTGIIEHATKTDYSSFGIRRDNPMVVKGQAGSPYAIKDYYDVDPDLAVKVDKRMKEFEQLVVRTHKAGMGVIMDFVPNHVAREYQSDAKPKDVRDLGEDDDSNLHFYNQNNFYYLNGRLHTENLPDQDGSYIEIPAKATGNDQFSEWPTANDWYETVKLNYGVDYVGGRTKHFDPIPSTWLKMTDILLFWASKGVDGFRCDMAEMVPVEFWHYAIARVKEQHPAIMFIAEVYNPDEYRNYIHYGGFDYLYDKVGLYDTLKNVMAGASTHDITRAWQAVDDIGGHMLNFLENHDEQRIASDFFAGDPIKGRPALIVSVLMNTCPFLNYFGQELGERGMDEEGYSGLDGRTTIFDYWTVESIYQWRGKKALWRRHQLPKSVRDLRDYYTRVFEIANTCDALREGDFYDLTYCNYNNPNYNIHRTFSFIRHSRHDVALVVVNFQGEDQDIDVNVPSEAWEYVGIKPGRRRHIENLLTGEWDFGLFSTTDPVRVKVPAYDAVVLRIKGK